jgi:hypothetical protein
LGLGFQFHPCGVVVAGVPFGSQNGTPGRLVRPC